MSYFGLTNQVPASALRTFRCCERPVVYTPRAARAPARRKHLRRDDQQIRHFRQKLSVNLPPVCLKVFSVGHQCYHCGLSGNFFIFPLTFRSAVLDLPSDVNSLRSGYTPLNHSPSLAQSNRGNVYGVPWIIGAKKGFPNFMNFGGSIVQVTRKLKLTRTSVTSSTYAMQHKQNYLIGITIIRADSGIPTATLHNARYCS